MRQEKLLISGATLIIDSNQSRKARRAELTKKMGYSRRHVASEKSGDPVEFADSIQREKDRQIEISLQRENLL